MEVDGLGVVGRFLSGKIWKSMSWVGYDGTVLSGDEGVPNGHRVENDSMVEEQECERLERRPRQCHMLEAQIGVFTTEA